MKKKTTVKVMSIILCLALVIGVAAPMAIGADDSYDAPNYTDTPVIYIHGQGADIVKINDDGTKTKVYPIEIPDGYLQKYLNADTLKMFLKCYFTNKWDAFEDTIEEAYVPLFEGAKLGKDGTPYNNSKCAYSNESRLTKKNLSGKYELKYYCIEYDWRLDPCTIADEVNRWVLKVCEITGKDKVALLGRCLGASIVTAYLEKYGYEHVSDVILYTSALDGATCASKSYAAKVYFDEDGLERFLYDAELEEFLDDPTIIRFLRAFYTFYNKIGGIKLILNEFNRVYGIIGADISGRLLRESFGTFPGFWAMVEDEDFEDAKQVCFGGQEVQWAELIKKIDYYHYNVMLKSDEILKEAEEAGVHVYNIEKYGFQEVPVTDTPEVVGDRVVQLHKSTKGATVMPLGSKFSDEYINKAFDNGTLKYVSCDRTIDASTCLFKDTTWIVKNLDHMNFDESVDELIAKLINSHGTMNVFSDPDYPQYLVCDTDAHTVSPMTNENCNTTTRWETNPWEAFRFCIFNFRYVLDFVLDYLDIDLF